MLSSSQTCLPHVAENTAKAFRGEEICFESSQESAETHLFLRKRRLEEQTPALEFGGLWFWGLLQESK